MEALARGGPRCAHADLKSWLGCEVSPLRYLEVFEPGAAESAVQRPAIFTRSRSPKARSSRIFAGVPVASVWLSQHAGNLSAGKAKKLKNPENPSSTSAIGALTPFHCNP